MSISPVFQMMMDEHKVIVRALDYCKTLDGRWIEDADGYAGRIRLLADFFRDYSDGYHHNKEEVDLFKEMIRKNEMLEDGIVGEFLEQHNDFRDYVADIREAVQAGEWDNSFKTLMEYREELLMHIEAEDDELFPMAETLFSEAEKENMYFRFLDIDRELGEERKKAFEDWAEALHS